MGLHDSVTLSEYRANVFQVKTSTLDKLNQSGIPAQKEAIEELKGKGIFGIYVNNQKLG